MLPKPPATIALGTLALDKKLGSGGFGTVYKAGPRASSSPSRSSSSIRPRSTIPRTRAPASSARRPCARDDHLGMRGVARSHALQDRAVPRRPPPPVL